MTHAPWITLEQNIQPFPLLLHQITKFYVAFSTKKGHFYELYLHIEDMFPIVF